MWADWFTDDDQFNLFYNENLEGLFNRSVIPKARRFGKMDPIIRFIAGTLFGNVDALDFNAYLDS